MEAETEVREEVVRPVIPIRDAPAEAMAWAVRWGEGVSVMPGAEMRWDMR